MSLNFSGKHKSNFFENVSRFSVLFFVLILSVSVFAEHNATLTLDPDMASCNVIGEFTPFTINVANDAGSTDKILQVEIYKALEGISDFSCGTAPTGWTLFSYEDRCIYVTGLSSASKIAPGFSLLFSFEATINSSACASLFTVVTIDDAKPVGDRDTQDEYVNIDCSDPELVKKVGDPKILMNPPCDPQTQSCDYWITQSTPIEFWAQDTDDDCDLGLDYCDVTVYLDGVLDQNYTVQAENIGEVYKAYDKILYGEDSSHELTIECYDVVGNKVSLTETEKVDDTPPETTKVISEPKKVIPGNDPNEFIEWIDTVTEITLDAKDGGNVCAIGVDKIWYMTKIDETEQACWDPYNYCSPLEFPTPHTPNGIGCINAGQEWCTINWDTTQEPRTYVSWEDCVEDFAHYECRVDPLWHLYDGTAISDIEESCHIMQYFSVDDLGNVEDMQTNCFFVDKTSPKVNKNNGDAILDRGEQAFMTDANPEGAFHWITTKMPVTFSCDDSSLGDVPHPSGDEELCYKVSYDYPQWGYITDQYCDTGLNQEGYCCVSATVKDSFKFYFEEESMHNLEYYCEDAVEKRSDTHIQYYKVDDTSPSISKEMLGTENVDWMGDCPPEDPSDVCYSANNNVGGVAISVKDGGEICAVDDVSCKYELWWNTNSDTCGDRYYENGMCLVDDGDFSTYKEILFHEDSTHVLNITCEDALGNSSEDLGETFLVDSTPPVTTKTYGTPAYPANINAPGPYPHWINFSTPIDLNAVDAKVGVNQIYWRYAVVDNRWCQTEASGCQNYQGALPDFTEYTGTINFDQESCHLIEFYSDDKLGNEETPNRQCVYVENTPPTITKEVGTPKIECIDDPLACDYYITQKTPITFTCIDEGDHPVDMVSISYRYRTSDDCADLSSAIFGGWITAPSAVKASSSSMRFSSTGWGGWSCPGGTVVVGGGYEPDPAYYPVAHSLAWKPGACVDSVCWPNTPFGYTYSEGETGWIVQNGGEAQDLTVYAMCATSFTFPEDSCHELEYKCEDALGNSTDVTTEIDVVDTKGPEITKTVVGPQVGNCPPSEEGDECFIDGVTEIHVAAVDSQPHPVEGVLCDWDYTVIGGDKIGEGETEVAPPFVINFPEESEHQLTIVCYDALGNITRDVETFFVDKTPPITTKSYGDPFFAEEGKEWITTATPITLTVEDAGPHKTGIEGTYYRITQVNKGYCDPEDREYLCSEATGTGAFLDYTAPFNAGEESCHLIEYYSKDNVDKTETVKKQCVYVDETPPTPVKTVGEPKTVWDGKDSAYYPGIGDLCWNNQENQIECWKVTLLTPITMACNDPQPHPVDHETIYFKAELDADDTTAAYCTIYKGSMTEDGWCHVNQKEVQFYFYEETEHNLKYYCEDALGNRGPVDDEKFKVEGTAFEIQLNKKWNLISVPFVLINDDIEEVLQDVMPNIESVWTYDATTGWYVYHPGHPELSNLDSITPGWGYWIRAYNPDLLVIGGSLFSPATTPPSRMLKEGWNLIGYYGTEGQSGYYGPFGNGKYAGYALFSLGDSYLDKGWTSLISYWEPSNPNQWYEFGYYNEMDPGAGYWISVTEDNKYEYVTNFGGLVI